MKHVDIHVPVSRGLICHLSLYLQFLGLVLAPTNQMQRRKHEAENVSYLGPLCASCDDDASASFFRNETTSSDD